MQGKDFLFWIARLSHFTSLFQFAPSETTQINLTHTMREYQTEVRNGLLCSRLPLGEPWRRAATMKDWLELQLGVAMTQFKNEPTEDRYKAAVLIMKEYRDAVFTGKVKLSTNEVSQ